MNMPVNAKKTVLFIIDAKLMYDIWSERIVDL